jgi:hypothetical protein
MQYVGIFTLFAHHSGPRLSRRIVGTAAIVRFDWVSESQAFADGKKYVSRRIAARALKRRQVRNEDKWPMPAQPCTRSI